MNYKVYSETRPDCTDNMELEMDYNPSLEIDPRKYLLVIGPQFTAAALKEVGVDSSSLALTMSQLLTLGIEVLLQTDECRSDAERVKCDTLYRNAYELDPLFAVKKLSANLQKNGKYEEWLKKAFDFHIVPCNNSPSLQRIKQLQQEGALVIYTHYDDALSQLTKTRPILMSDVPYFEKWCRGESNGFLHLHGVYTDHETVVFDTDTHHPPNHPLTAANTQLTKVFCNRHILMLGYDSENNNDDPILTQFAERYIAEFPHRLHTIHLTQSRGRCDSQYVQNVSCIETPGSCLYPLSHTSMDIWKQLEIPQNNSTTLTLSLLVAKKEGATDISRVLGDGPGVNFALVSSVNHNGCLLHTVSVRLEKARQKEMWEWLLERERGQLLARGLMAVILQSGTFLWMRGKPTSYSEMPQEVNTSPLPQSPQSLTDSDRPFPMIKLKEEPISISSLDFTFSKNSGRKVPRYTMHQVRARRQPYTVTGSGPSLGKHGRPDVPLFGQSSSRSLLERRASLPVNVMNGNSAHNLDRLVHNLSTPQGHDLPSYAAVKQALLCDWYKRRRSIQVDPKTLKLLLKSKLLSEPLDLLKLRRYSDPGSYISQPESFARRKELFLDENRTWSQTYGAVIKQKITTWKTIREEKQRQRMLSWKNSQFQQNGLKYHLLNPLQSNGVPSHAQMFSTGGMAPNGINSYVYPAQTILAPTASQAPSSMVYSPFIAPYTLVNPYQSLMQVGQPTAFYVPQAASQQKLVYLVPPTSTGADAHPLVSLNNSHLAPPPALTRKRSDSGVRDADEDYQMKEYFKRRQSVPNNLSSLLVSPLSQLSPDSPPPMKRMRLTEESPLLQAPSTVHFEQDSPKQELSSRQHHLLQVHRHQKLYENGSSRSASRSPTRSVGQSSANSPTHLQRNGDYFDSDCSSLDEEEAEIIVGGAILSPNQHPGYGAPTPHSQLQLWQFLLELLLISANTHLIQWTSNTFEFQINKPLDVARLWGKVTNNEHMDYQKLLKGLHYYFNKGIMSKVKGKPLSFQYNGSIQSYIEMRRSNLASQEEMVIVE